MEGDQIVRSFGFLEEVRYVGLCGIIECFVAVDFQVVLADFLADVFPELGLGYQ